MNNPRLKRYRIRKNTKVFLNYTPEIDVGDLLYFDACGDNLGELFRCSGMTNSGIHRYQKVKHSSLRNHYPTYDYDNDILYWWDAGRYKEKSPFEIVRETENTTIN